MTHAEQQSINKIHDLLSQIRKDNNDFKESVNTRLQAAESKVEAKHIPLQLEAEVFSSIHKAMEKALVDALGGYNSPLQKYAINIVAKYQPQIEATFDQVVSEAIKTDQFKERVREVLLHKIAKTMISGIDGSVDKTINQMKQDAVFRSRLTLSVNTLVNEFLSQK